ncbi:hypothetical protein BUALT_BualtUnG0013600 [Buddleja alternifolia]|uniref:DUF3741 domain-containing protein n=1 Tax=Buddleja alternifolia TaxID=168488 RepID=A0AAV6W0L7_9LAMI|nr:hypothetical protein BUALT_BualtUnG0013600 [Buddleja alternifolia]
MMPSSSFSSSNGRSSGCISRILRRILCFNSLPPGPFDHLKEEEKETLLECASGTPGIVARLMGLDSLPRVESIDGSPSVNSADSCKKSRSSLVRRRQIIPTYQELEDENFFILSFEQGGETMVFPKERKRLTKRDKCKKNKLKNESLSKRDKENEDVNKVSIRNSDNSDFQVKDSRNVLRPLKNSNRKSEKLRKKNFKEDGLALINLEMGGDSENSSPNSVLDFVEFPAAPETACPGGISRLSNSKLRRTLCEELENCRKLKEKKLINQEQKHNRLRNMHQNYDEKWDEIVKLAGREMVKSSWVRDEISINHVYLKEIGRDVASEMLDQLIIELLLDNFG